MISMLIWREVSTQYKEVYRGGMVLYTSNKKITRYRRPSRPICPSKNPPPPGPSWVAGQKADTMSQCVVPGKSGGEIGITPA